MKPFVINRYGRIVFPFNFVPTFDFSVFDSLEQFSAVIRRDFEDKAPAESDIVSRILDKWAGDKMLEPDHRKATEGRSG